MDAALALLLAEIQKGHSTSNTRENDLEYCRKEAAGILHGIGHLRRDISREVHSDFTASSHLPSSNLAAPRRDPLILDRNGNGLIDSGRELFGDATINSDGTRAADGFAALADLDSNADGTVSSLDAQFADLRVWRDLNQDGISQSGELFTLNALGIAAINVAKTANNQTLTSGNQIADLGTYTRSDGSVGTSGTVTDKLADINLAGDTFHRQFTDTLDTRAVATLPDMHGSGAVRDLREAASLSPALAATLQGLTGAGVQTRA